MHCTYLRICGLFASLLLGLALFQGCGPIELEGDVREITVEIEELVHRPTNPIIYIRPKGSPDRELTALFFPFRMRQSVQDPFHYGREVGQVFWQVWLQEEVFKVMEFYNQRPWPGAEAAVAQGRAKGADLVIGGDVTHFMAGGDVGDSRVALRLQIYDVYSGAMIWSMSHSGEMINRGKQDFIFFQKKSAMPNDPVFAIIYALAYDMSGPVKRWMKPVRDKGPCEDCPEEDTL